MSPADPALARLTALPRPAYRGSMAMGLGLSVRAGLLALALSACGDSGAADSDATGGTGDATGASATDGADTDEPTSGEPAGPCAGIEPGDQVIRRLNRAEFRNTVRDLLAYDGDAASELAPDPLGFGFDNNAEALAVTTQQASEYLRTAEKLALWATEDARLPGLLGCAPDIATADAATQQACVAGWLPGFGRQAYRRPLTADETTTLLATYTRGAEESFADGVQYLLTRMLLAPDFMYRVELGVPVPGETDIVRLTSWELASRLSYLLWQGPPDAALLDAAAADALSTPEQIAAQVDRLLADDRARDTVQDYFRQLLELDGLADFSKAGIPASLGPLMRAETERFIEHVVWDSEGTLRELLSASYTIIPKELAYLYNVVLTEFPADAVPGESYLVQLDPAQRAGILTHASLMSILATPTSTRPIARGKFVREKLLCAPVPPPPPGVNATPPPPDPSATTREQYEQHADDPACSGCHATFDGLGFAFEHYSAVGQYRLQDNGKPIDASGEVPDIDIGGPFADGVELMLRLADDDKVLTCGAKQMLRFGYGRVEGAKDSCTVDDLAAQFIAADGDIKSLLRALTTTEAFLYRRAGGTQ